MISPHTPPGTKIVCINARDCQGYLREGEVYTVAEMAVGHDVNPASPTYMQKTIGVRLVEVPYGPVIISNPITTWGRRRFRRLELPKCLTDILERAKTPSPQKERV